mmetsp:Transcript_18132/g.39530  ORF Transcript_18132/g.39530 Transcript_18132/m.39530 type:complete len:228 (+) Transcript_18132:289-972(+)
MPAPNPPIDVTLLLAGLTGLYVLFPPPPPMFEKANSLSCTSTSSSSSPHPSSSPSSLPHPSSTTGAGCGALNEVAANCCTGGWGVGCAACTGAAGAAAGSGVAAVEVLIHEESPDKYPLFCLALVVGAVGFGDAVVPPAATAAAGAAPACCRRCDDVDVPGAPSMGGSPSSVIRFDSCCIASNKSRTTRKASCLTSVIGSNNKGITLGITLIAKSCLVNSNFDFMSD